MRFQRLALSLTALCCLAVFSACGKSAVEEAALEDQADVPSQAVTAEESSEDAEQEKASEEADRKLQDGTVEITISGELLGENAVEELSEEQKDMGYQSATVNADGSVTYVIDSEKYEIALIELRKESVKALEAMTNGEVYRTIRGVLYDDNLETITLVVSNQAEFEQSATDSFSVWQAGLTGCLYQEMRGEQDYTVTVNLQDSASGDIFSSAAFPEAFNQ
jgi:hypothetical protein